jgi:hypothetical protein
VVIPNWNTAPYQPERIKHEDNDYYLRLLTSQPGQNGGVPGLTDVTIGECGLGPRPSFNCPTTPWNTTGTAESNAFQTVIQGTQFGTSTTGPQQQRYRGR